MLITPADVQDRHGAKPLLWNLRRAFRSVKPTWAAAATPANQRRRCIPMRRGGLGVHQREEPRRKELRDNAAAAESQVRPQRPARAGMVEAGERPIGLAR